MEKEVLRNKNISTLFRIWDIMYAPLGWESVGPIKQIWSWKHLCFVYEIIAKRENPKPIVEVVNNKSEINTHKGRFVIRTSGILYEKEFWYNPKEFDLNDEFKKWANQIKSIVVL